MSKSKFIYQMTRLNKLTWSRFIEITPFKFSFLTLCLVIFTIGVFKNLSKGDSSLDHSQNNKFCYFKLFDGRLNRFSVRGQFYYFCFLIQFFNLLLLQLKDKTIFIWHLKLEFAPRISAQIRVSNIHLEPIFGAE